MVGHKAYVGIDTPATVLFVLITEAVETLAVNIALSFLIEFVVTMSPLRIATSFSDN